MVKFLIAAFLPTLAIAQIKCAFQSNAAPVEFSLPLTALSHPLLDLPIEFRGVSPIVTRKPLKHGEPPKVTIERYSSKPDIYYDEVTERVVIATASCLETASSSAFRSLPTTVGLWLSLLHPTTRPLGTVFVVAMGLAQANAHDEACMPVVQVVVQAPSAYQGAVETCYEEIDDPAICPDPFPTFATCNNPSPSCKVAVVGAGAGGLYTAMRMMDEGKIAGEDICVFEMTERVGGRLFSLRGLGPDGDLSVDAGGYRTVRLFCLCLLDHSFAHHASSCSGQNSHQLCILLSRTTSRSPWIATTIVYRAKSTTLLTTKARRTVLLHSLRI